MLCMKHERTQSRDLTPIRTWEYWYFQSNPVTILGAWGSLPCPLPGGRSLHPGLHPAAHRHLCSSGRQIEAKGELVVRVWKELLIIHPLLPQINFKNLFCLCKTARSQTNANTANFLHYILETSKPVMSNEPVK